MTPSAADGFPSGRHCWLMAVAAPARLSAMQLRERLGRVGALSERQRTRLPLGACLPLALLLRAPYLSTPLGIDEGEIAYSAQFCGHPIYLRNRPASPRPTPGREAGAITR